MTLETGPNVAAVVETPGPEDEAAIRTCVLDYFEGWFDGDVERIDRALHPGLAKHSLRADRDGNETVDVTTKPEMLDATRRGLGRRRDVHDRAIRIDIVAFGGDIASVVVHSAVYLEYAFLARTRDGWRITGTLWRFADGYVPRD